jgi:anti-anti-sigma regulatory factor
VTTTFKCWVDHRIGLIEVDGPLDNDAIPLLREAIADAAYRAGTPRVLIVEDEITQVSEDAALVLVEECTALRDRGGNMGLVSTDGNITQDGRPSSRTLFMPTYNSLELGFERLDKDDVL